MRSAKLDTLSMSLRKTVDKKPRFLCFCNGNLTFLVLFHFHNKPNLRVLHYTMDNISYSIADAIPIRLSRLGVIYRTLIANGAAETSSVLA